MIQQASQDAAGTTLQWGLSPLVHGLSVVMETQEALRSFSALPSSCPQGSVRVGNRRKASQKQAPALASQLLRVHWPVGQALPFPLSGAHLFSPEEEERQTVRGEVDHGP